MASNKIRATYLSPLLTTHNQGKTITFEDLVTSYEAAKKQLATISGNSKSNPQNNEKYSDDLESLHASQLDAYRIAATKELESYTISFHPPKIDDISTTTLQNYLESCKNKAKDDCDGWRNTDKELEDIVLKAVKEKADRYYHSLQSQGSDSTSDKAETIKTVPKAESMEVTVDETQQIHDDEQHVADSPHADDEEEHDEEDEDHDEENTVDEHTINEDHTNTESKTPQDVVTTASDQQSQNKARIKKVGTGKQQPQRKAQQIKKRADTLTKKRGAAGRGGGRRRKGKNVLS